LMEDLIVVGGGIAGLIAAVIACRKGLHVKIIEASNRIGGQIFTHEHHNFTESKVVAPI